MVQAGAVRLNRQPTDKPHARLRAGDVLTLVADAGGPVRVWRVRALAARRGPAPEARRLYDDLDAPTPGGESHADGALASGDGARHVSAAPGTTEKDGPP